MSGNITNRSLASNRRYAVVDVPTSPTLVTTLLETAEFAHPVTSPPSRVLQMAILPGAANAITEHDLEEDVAGYEYDGTGDMHVIPIIHADRLTRLSAASTTTETVLCFWYDVDPGEA